MDLCKVSLASVATSAAILIAHPVAAEVRRVSEAGFVVSGRLELSGEMPDDAWQMLIHPEAWWDSDHTWSGDATNLSIEPVAGGCFCEAIPGTRHGSAEHMRVIQARPGQLLVMRGSLGPLQTEALTGVLTITTEQTPGTAFTWLDWSYVVGGYSGVPLIDLAPAVDVVVTAQMERLQMTLSQRYDTYSEQFELPNQ